MTDAQLRYCMKTDIGKWKGEQFDCISYLHSKGSHTGSHVFSTAGVSECIEIQNRYMTDNRHLFSYRHSQMQCIKPSMLGNRE